MDIKARKCLLIALVCEYIRTTETIPADPDKAADALFTALLQDWERISCQSQAKLIETMAILTRCHGAEERAEAEAKRIIGRMMGRA